jgi:hypothetical protein
MAAPENCVAGKRWQPMSAPTAIAEVPFPRPMFSEELRQLAHRFGGRSVPLGILFQETQQRGLQLLLLLMALPFVGPIPLPGFSIPFGVVVAVIGMRLAVGARPWLPAAVLRYEVPPRFLDRMLTGTSRLMKGLEHFVRPRLSFIANHEIFARLAGLMIGVSGLFLILPLPLPFSNSLPAWTVILLCAGTLGRDGLFFILGGASFLLSVAYFALVFLGGEAAIEQLLLFWNHR